MLFLYSYCKKLVVLTPTTPNPAKRMKEYFYTASFNTCELNQNYNTLLLRTNKKHLTERMPIHSPLVKHNPTPPEV